MKKILITGVNGLQGKAVAEELRKQNYTVYGLTTDATKADPNLYTAAVGNFDDAASLIRALHNVQYVYFVLPALFNKNVLLRYTKNFIQAANKAKPELIVFNAGIFVPQQPEGVLAFDIKLEVEHLLRRSGLPVIYLHPRVYLDNLAAPWSVTSIVTNGIIGYPIQEAQPVSWISLYDLARFTAAGFNKPELAGSVFEVGASPITGNEMARELAIVLNRKIDYIAVDSTEYEISLSTFLDAHVARSIADIYRHHAANREDVLIRSNTASRILGIEPISFAQWSATVPWQLLNDSFTSLINK